MPHAAPNSPPGSKCVNSPHVVDAPERHLATSRGSREWSVEERPVCHLVDTRDVYVTSAGGSRSKSNVIVPEDATSTFG